MTTSSIAKLSIKLVRDLQSRENVWVSIQNVVATASLKQRFDLNSIVRSVPGSTWRPEVFPGLVYRLKNPKTTMLIFNSGKMVCTGAKSERQAKKAVMKVVDELKKNGVIIMGTPEIQIQNIVSTGELGGLIDLEKTAHSLERCMYEPEQFPGLIYRMQEPKAVILLFANGKFVCTGSKKEEEIPRTITILKKTLEEKDLISHN